MKSVLLSIIIPVYNVERYLHDCFNSISSCINQDCEVLFVDDGSTDNSGAICDDISKQYHNVFVIHKENGGLSDARNAGINSASGKYLLFLDSDDKLAKNSILDIIELLKNETSDVILGRAMTFDDHGADNKHNIDSYIKYDNIHDPAMLFCELDKDPSFWFAAWLLIVRREFIVNKNLYFQKGLYHEDELWVPIVFVNSANIKLTDLCFYHYRINREGSIISSPKIKREFDKLLIAKTLHDYKCMNQSGSVLLKRRSAALVFGVILSLDKYKDDEKYGELLTQIRTSINMMMYGKYLPIGIVTKLIGPEIVSHLIGNRVC